jgi:hypothetical protein
MAAGPEFCIMIMHYPGAMLVTGNNEFAIM